MECQDLMVDGYSRVPEFMENVLSVLNQDDLNWQPHEDCNSIGWIFCASDTPTRCTDSGIDGLGVRLVSIMDDSMLHAGKAAYIRGLRQGKRWQKY